ncbi:MAG TPA: phosphate ABC transporter permease PstA [Nitrososphaerales archaeon]|nr:phosphate ABC transporter permease PstA [Nitrososphaerales archaeon]
MGNREGAAVAGRRRVTNTVMTAMIFVAVVLALIPLVLIIGDVVFLGYPALSVSFLTGLPQGPLVIGGVANAIEGSVVMVALASAIAVPVGVGAGIYFSEWPESRVSFLSSFTNDVLAEFPTITLGIFVYIIIVAPTRTFSAVAGATALAIVMLPIVARTTEESLKIVPVSLREASMALGIPRWKTILKIVIGTGRGGLATGVLLAVARAAGETAPLILTALYSNFLIKSLWQPTGSLPYLIYYYGGSSFQELQTAAWGAALILVAFMLVLNLSVKFFIGRRFAGVRAEI